VFCNCSTAFECSRAFWNALLMLRCPCVPKHRDIALASRRVVEEAAQGLFNVFLCIPCHIHPKPSRADDPTNDSFHTPCFCNIICCGLPDCPVPPWSSWIKPAAAQGFKNFYSVKAIASHHRTVDHSRSTPFYISLLSFLLISVSFSFPCCFSNKRPPSWHIPNKQ